MVLHTLLFCSIRTAAHCPIFCLRLLSLYEISVAVDVSGPFVLFFFFFLANHSALLNWASEKVRFTELL